VAYWGGGQAGGWSGDQRGVQRGRPVDGWDYDELGRVYDAGLVKRLFPFLRPYKAQTVVATIAMLVFAVASYAQPFVMALATTSIVDKLRSGTPEDLAAVDDQILRFGALLVGLATISFASAALQRLMTGYVGHQILRDLRSQMFAHLNKLSLSFFDREEVGRVMSRVTSDVVTLQELITSGFLNILADIVGLALIVLFLFLLDPLLAAISLSVIPVLLVFMVWWQSPAARAFIRVRQAISVVNGSINENVSGVRIVQSLNREDENLQQFERLNRDNLDANMGAVKLQAAVIPMVEMLSTVATSAVLIVIGVRVFSGDLTAGEALGFAIGFLLFIQRFFNPVRDIVLQYTMLRAARRRGPDRLQRRRFQLRRRRPGAARLRPAHRARRDGRVRRPHGRRQDHRDRAGQPLVRHRGRRDPDRRHRLAADPARLADAAHERGPAGAVPVLGHDRRQHPLRPPRRDRRGGRRRRARGRRERVHRAARGRL
jgi:ATP-binding cassette subfamily B protein